MKNTEQEENRTLQPIPGGDRQGERNPVFFKAKVIQVFRILNPERNKIFGFNFDQRNIVQQLRFGKQKDRTLDLNSSQICFDVNPSTLNPPINPPDYRNTTQHNTTLNREIPSAVEPLGLWRLHQSTKKSLSENFTEIRIQQPFSNEPEK